MHLSIPDAAVELGVSETRLRKTLMEGVYATVVEFRQTKTGVRKTTCLPQSSIDALREFFNAPLPDPVLIDSNVRNANQPDNDKAIPVLDEMETALQRPSQITHDETNGDSVAVREAAVSYDTAQTAIPAARFNALLYQHNVLREEFGRVTQYLDDCDRLLGEMVKTIAALEERTRSLECMNMGQRKPDNPLKGALRSVTANVHNAVARRPANGMPQGRDVYYSNVLAGR